MLDNTIITKFELSEREKLLKKQFFQREEDIGKKYLFNRPKENENDSFNNNSNLINNSHSLSLEQNINTFNNLNINISEKKSLNKSVKNEQNQNLSKTVPDIKNITKEEMNKFYEEAGNYLPKSNGGMSSEQINLLLHQNKIMQRNVDALQETNRSLQDFIIYSMKKDSIKNGLKEEEKLQEQEKSNNEYNKWNQILTPLYNHINNLQSQVKELNQKKREDEINIELDDLIIKDQKTFKPKHDPLSQPKQKSLEREKSEKMMMKTLTSLKGTMSNLSEEMRKIGNTFNEKMQKVLEDTEKTKLKTMIGGRAKSSVNKSRVGFGNKNVNKDQSNNISLFKDNINLNESILTNKLDNIDYNSFKSELIDIGKMQDEIVNEYKSSCPEFIELKKPKSKIKFSYNLDPDIIEKDDKISSKKISKPKQNINKFENKNIKDSKIAEKVSNAVNNEKEQKISKTDNNKKKENGKKKEEKQEEKVRAKNEQKNKIYINNDINREKEKDEYNKKVKELNGLSVVDRMNEYKERMAEQARKMEEQDKQYNQINNNKKSLNEINQINSLNNIGSEHSGITFQKFNKPSSQNQKQLNQKSKIKLNPPKVEYGIFGSQNNFSENNQKKSINNNKNEIVNPNIIIPETENINNMIKTTIDNYLAAAFGNLKPSEAPKININEEKNVKSPQKNEVQRVFEKEYIVQKIKEVEKVPQPIVNIQPSEQHNIEQNNKLIEKFTSLAEKFTNLEEKVSKQIYEQKNTIEKKIEIIEKREKEPRNIQQPPPQKKLVIPDTDAISRLVMEKIKSKMDIDEQYNINYTDKKKKKKKKEKKEVIIKPKEEEKKEEKIDILDINKNTKNEELDDIIRMPHKINLAEYEVSQTSSYLSESLQNNNFNYNNNNSNQININKIKINIQENEYVSDKDESKIENNNNHINDSKSNGEIESDNENSSENNDYKNVNINNNINNKINYNSTANNNGIDLLTVKNANENLQNNINILDDNNKNIANNDFNKFHDFMNYINNNENQNINKMNPNLDPFQNDDFFNDSGENK